MIDLWLYSDYCLIEGRTNEERRNTIVSVKDRYGKRDKILNLELRKKNLELGIFFAISPFHDFAISLSQGPQRRHRGPQRN
jgi:hypothetical protein